MDPNIDFLAEEIILKVLCYLRPIDLLASGQVSTKFRRLSHDDTIWQKVYLVNKIVKKEFLEMMQKLEPF